MTSFVSLLSRKRSSVPVRFHRLNCSSVAAIVAEIVEIFLLAREVENKIYKGGIVWISECYLSKMSSHVILSYPPAVFVNRNRNTGFGIVVDLLMDDYDYYRKANLATFSMKLLCNSPTHS